MTPKLSDSETKQVMIRMTPEMHQAVKDHAARNDRTMAQTVRRAVRLYLENPNE